MVTFLMSVSVILVACQPIVPSSREMVNGDESLVAVIDELSGLAVNVQSERGIGSASVTLPHPQPILLRLHLNGLEELRFAYGEVEMLASVSSSDASLRESVRLGDGDEEAIEPDSPYWMDVRILDAAGAPTTTIPLQGGIFEVTAPADFLTSGQSEFSILWVDFFR
jgi:hypothetical protein